MIGTPRQRREQDATAAQLQGAGSQSGVDLSRGPKVASTKSKRGRPTRYSANVAAAAAKKAAAQQPGREGWRPRGLPIKRLPAPSARQRKAISPDAILWVRCLLPKGFQGQQFALAFIHRLRLLPHLAYDPALSLPIARLAGHIHRPAFRSSNFAREHHWGTQFDKDKLDTALSAFVGFECWRRARAKDSQTHRHRLRPTRTALGLGLASKPRGKEALNAAALSDAKEIVHRRRANGKADELVAIVDLACDRVGDDQPMVTERVLRRYLEKARDFDDWARKRQMGLLTRQELGGQDGEAAYDGGEASNLEEMVAAFGQLGAVKRVHSLAWLAASKGRSDHERRVRIVDALVQTWSANQAGLVALHIRLNLAGSLLDVAHPRFAMTPRDCARLLARIAATSFAGIDAAAYGVLDSTPRGWPHMHVIAVVDRDQCPELKARIAAAYEEWRMDPTKPSGDLDERLVHFDELTERGEPMWRYPIKKLAPSDKTAADLLARPQDITPEIRLAAWRQVHGIRATWSFGLENMGVARALGAIDDGAHPLIDAARLASAAGKDGAAALGAVGYAPRIAPPDPNSAAFDGLATERMETEGTVELDLPADDRALKAVVKKIAAVGPAVTTADLARMRVRLPRHATAFTVKALRFDEGQLRTVTLERRVTTKQPTGGKTVKILEPDGSGVLVDVLPRGGAVAVGTRLDDEGVVERVNEIGNRARTKLVPGS